jgi:hypothetical protein
MTIIEIPEGYKVVFVNLELQKQSRKKYYEANHEKIKVQRAKHYKERYHNDEVFREKELTRIKNNILKKNSLKNTENSLKNAENI